MSTNYLSSYRCVRQSFRYERLIFVFDFGDDGLRSDDSSDNGKNEQRYLLLLSKHSIDMRIIEIG